MMIFFKNIVIYEYDVNGKPESHVGKTTVNYYSEDSFIFDPNNNELNIRVK